MTIQNRKLVEKFSDQNKWSQFQFSVSANCSAEYQIFSDDGFWSVVGHLFLFFTSHSSTNRMAQSTDVMFAFLFLVKTSKGFSRVFISSRWHLLKNSIKINKKRGDAKKMTIKIWLQKYG